MYTDVYKGHTSAVVLLPKWVYIKDRCGRYLSNCEGPKYATLTLQQGDPDLDCAFEAIGFTTGPEWYDFRGRSGNYIMRYHNDSQDWDWYPADSGYPYHASFQIITSTGNPSRVYLKDDYAPSLFISDKLRDNGAPLAHAYINESSQFEILQVAIKNEITDVQYDTPGGKVREAFPVIALSTSIRNDSDGNVNQTLSYAYKKWLVGTWNNSAGTMQA